MAFTVRTATAATAALMLASAVRAAPNGGKQLGSILAMGGGGWQMAKAGRATDYGGGDAVHSSLDTGSCMQGRIAPPMYVTAVNVPGSGNTDKCGQCYEVACVDGPERGLNNSRLGPESACRAPGVKSVVVQVTDSCPCVYPGNAASNKMWCCGDVPMHFDLSYTAFDVLARRDKGVVDLVWRKVDCATRKNSVTSYQPAM